MGSKDKKGNQKKFNEIVKKIKKVEIQGARNVARAALKAYKLVPTEVSKKKLLASRPTEPMMQNVLKLAGTMPMYKITKHFTDAQDEINKNVLRLISQKEAIFTHCHSTNVVKALIHARTKGKRYFEVYNTETRPLLQGRKTAKELKRANIPVTMFIDSALGIPLRGEDKDMKKADKVFLGADAITSKGVINKIGSRTIAEIAKNNKVPVYIIADSWKFTTEKLPIEQRNLNEIWDNAPKKIKIKNPAFEFIPKKYIRALVTELGILSYPQFMKVIKKNERKNKFE